MSKRTAQGPHGSKDDDPFLEMSSTPNETPQRATAAQLASRKIKDIRRRPRGTTPTGGSEQPSNAFGGLSAPSISSPAPSFGAPAPQSGGFTFGQSQSFPGATSSSTQPTQNSSTPFSFGGGDGAQSGFNFGVSSGGFGSSSFNNPFASGAGKTDSTPATQNSSFGGFNFGGNQSASQPAQSSQPAFSFGAQTANAPSTSGMFGQSNNTNSAASPADSMQMSPDAKPKTSTNTPSFQSRSLFGESAPNPFSPKPAAAASNPFSNLNGSAATEKPASDKTEGFASKPAFAGQSAPASNQTAPFGNIFGASATTAKPSEAEKPAPTNLFGTGSSQSAFTGFAASKPTSDQATPNNIFGAKPTSEQKTDTSADANPFKNLLGATAPAQSASQSQTTPAPNLFAPKPATEQTPSNPAEPQPFKNLFGNAAASGASKASDPQQPASTPSAPTNLFSSKPAMDQSTAKPADATPFKSLFGASTDKAKPSETPREEQSPAQNLFSAKPAAAQPTPNNIFAPKPNPDQTPDKPANANPFSSLLGASTSKANTSEPEPAKPQSTPAPNLFASSMTSQDKSSGGLFGPKPDATSQLSTSPASLNNTSSFTNAQPVAPPQIPKSDFAKSADKSNSQLISKLRVLDTIFKEELSTYQPGVDGFDSLIIYYMGMRQALGAPVGSKNDWKTNGAVPTTNGQAFKNSAAINGANDSATSSVFAQSFSSPAKPAEPAKTLTSSSASPAKQPENPFAKISTSAQAASPAPAAKNSETSAPPKLAGNMFANPQASQGSAAPLSMPKFGNGTSGVDFMAQFKKKAEESEAKEKAKRKAEDFDSDEDDEEEWERRDAEKQREKRAKLESSSKKKAVFVPGKGFSFVDADEEAQDDTEKLTPPAASPAPSSGSIFDSSSKPVPASQNIFGRISSTPQSADEDNDSNASDEAKPPSPKRPAAGDEDDSEHQAKRSKATENGETSKSSLDTPIPAPTAAAGRSLFDRIESPTPSFASPKPSPGGIDFGASIASNSGNPFASLGAKSQTSQLFGSSFNTSSAQPSTTSPTPADNTWKPTTPIKFASDTNSASVQPSTEASAQTSGAENATSGAATPDEESAPGSIFDMSSANAGEEDETVIFECRARAFKLTTGWVSQGTGTVRLLKHPGTGRARVVLRADPGGNIILNTLLKKELDYARTSNSMQFMVPQADGKPEQWAVRVKAESIDALNEKIQAIKN